MSLTAATHHLSFKSPTRTLAEALFGDIAAHPPHQEPVSVHLMCFNEPDSSFLAKLLAEEHVAIRTYGNWDAFARPKEIHEASCLLIDASVFECTDHDIDFRALCAELPTIIIARPDELRAAVQAMKMGAIDLLESPLDPGEASCVVKSAICASRAWRQLSFCLQELQARFSALTRRERQVLGLVAKGRLNKQIAWSLGVSEITVKAHRGSVMRKMGARSLADLVRMADALGELIDENSSSHLGAFRSHAA